MFSGRFSVKAKEKIDRFFLNNDSAPVYSLHLQSTRRKSKRKALAPNMQAKTMEKSMMMTMDQ